MANEVFCPTPTFKAITLAVKLTLSTVNTVSFSHLSYILSPLNTTTTL